MCDYRKPADLWEFWDETRAELAAVAPEFESTPAPEHSGLSALVYHVTMKSFGSETIHGWYAVPLVPEGMKIAGLLTMPGYNMVGDVNEALKWARKGFAALQIIPRGQGPERYPDGSKGKVAHNVTDRYEYAYRKLYMDCLRGIDFLEAQPEVQHGKIAIAGGSQGGGLTLATAALCGERAAVCAASVPFLGNFPWVMANDITTNPYCELTEYLAEHPDHWEQAAETLGYFDPVNLVEHIACPAFVVIGMKDVRCPPETIFPTFEHIPTMKQLIVAPDVGHESLPDLQEHMLSWLARYL